MRCELVWKDVWKEKDEEKGAPINDVKVTADGQRIIVAARDCVLVYNAKDGDLLQPLQAHKDTVYTVDCSSDGKRFASGGADDTVIIWVDHTFRGELKYKHQDAIQKVVYNPVTLQLLSCTGSDFGLWYPDQRSVDKHRVEAKILSADWTPSGLHFALGFFNGKVQIRDKDGTERLVIERNAPVWTLAWSPARDDREILAVGCWDQTLSFYKVNGLQHYNKDRRLGFDPNSLSWFDKGEYLVVGGSDKKATLCTKEGVKLATIAEEEAWLWTVAAKPAGQGHSGVVVGTNEGTIAYYRIDFDEVHGIFCDRYAYRENLTDVVVQHLLTEQRVRIKCRDYVKNIAVYKNRLAVQLQDRVHVYEQGYPENDLDMHYRVKEKIYKDLPCDHLLVASQHVLLSKGNKVQLFPLHPPHVVEREWGFEADVKAVRIDGGPEGAEGVLVGLSTGAVYRIFLNNAFPILVAEVQANIQMLDISPVRRKLAIVDTMKRLKVVNLETKEVDFFEENVDSIVFNTEEEDLMCYSAAGQLHLKAGKLPVKSQTIDEGAIVIGFRGCRVTYLHDHAVKTLQTSQISATQGYMQEKNFRKAYDISALGATRADWKCLGIGALENGNLTTARQCFRRLRDMRFLELIDHIEVRRKTVESEAVRQEISKAALKEQLEKCDALARAEILAYQGRYQEAGKAFSRANDVDRAVQLFVDLRMWEEAKVFAANSSKVDLRDLTKLQAKWAEETSDWKTASEMYVNAGEFSKAAQIITDNVGEGWQLALSEVAEACPRNQPEALRICGRTFMEHEEFGQARDVFKKLGDYTALMQLYVTQQDWDAAVKLSEEHDGEFDSSMFLPYAEWLALQDRFDEALRAYAKASRPDLSFKLMEQLTLNAVLEGRFKDASYYYHLLSEETLRGLAEGGLAARAAAGLPITVRRSAEKDDEKDAKEVVMDAVVVTEGVVKLALERFWEYRRHADLYYAFQRIRSFTSDPFTSLLPEVLFQVARYIINCLGSSPAPYGISRVHTLYTLAKQAKALGAYKFARFAYQKLQQLKVPSRWQDQIDFDMLAIQAKPMRDNPELLSVCYRCGETNKSLLNMDGDMCSSCLHPFIRSFINFDILPLVEFVPEDRISEEEALELIRSAPPAASDRASHDSKWHETRGDGADFLTLGEDGKSGVTGIHGAVDDSTDLFSQCVNSALDKQEYTNRYCPVVVDARTLTSLRRDEVFVTRMAVPPERAGDVLPAVGGKGKDGAFIGRLRYYKNMLAGIHVALSQPCGRFAHEEEFEYAYLKEGGCPFSRVKDLGDYSSV